MPDESSRRLSLPAPSRAAVLAGSALLAAVAGFVDAACLVGLFGVFTAHVTGNIATLSSELIHPTTGYTLRLEVLVAYASGAALGRLATVRKNSSAERAPVLRRLLALEALWLLILLGAFAGWGTPRDPDALATQVFVFCAGAAMGTQSAISVLSVVLDHSTTMMTGNFTRWAISGVDLLRRDRAVRRDAGWRFALLSAVLLVFALGALTGALAQARFGLIVFVAPTAAVCLLAALPFSARA